MPHWKQDTAIVPTERLRSLVYLETRNEKVQTPSGEITETWDANPLPRMAWIHPVSGREVYMGNEILAETTHKIVMRYNSTHPKDRLRYVDPVTNVTRYFNVIAAYDPDERKRMIHVLAKEEL